MIFGDFLPGAIFDDNMNPAGQDSHLAGALDVFVFVNLIAVLL